MNGRVNGWINGRVNGWMNGWRHGRATENGDKKKRKEARISWTVA